MEAHGRGEYGEQPRTYESQEFISYIHRLWIAASDLSRQIHRSVMHPRMQGGESDLAKYHDWVSVLLELWAQIYPFVNANIDDEDFKERFNKWENRYYDPILFEEDSGLEDEIRFYRDIAEALHRLKITSIEAPF